MKDRAYFEIRLESLGGLGANLCGKMLGELGVKYLGLNGAAFSSYGSEKRGSPVSSFIRWCDGDEASEDGDQYSKKRRSVKSGLSMALRLYLLSGWYFHSHADKKPYEYDYAWRYDEGSGG